MAKKKNTKLATWAMQKGGAGKSTLLYNFAEWLSEVKKKNVLLVDLDYQGSITESFGYIDPENGALGLFTGDEIEVRHIHDNLDLIPADYELEDVPLELRARGVQDVHFLLQDWLLEHEEQILEYDYVFFDTHPDTLTVTQNALATSDYQIAPVEPSYYGYNAVPKAIGALNRLKKETYDKRRNEDRITTELIFVLNKLVATEDETKELLNNVKDDNLKVTASFSKHTAFSKSISLKEPPVYRSSLKKEHRDEIIKGFEKIKKQIDK